jgi:hypothetical protein
MHIDDFARLMAGAGFVADLNQMRQFCSGQGSGHPEALYQGNAVVHPAQRLAHAD